MEFEKEQSESQEEMGDEAVSNSAAILLIYITTLTFHST